MPSFCWITIRAITDRGDFDYYRLEGEVEEEVEDMLGDIQVFVHCHFGRPIRRIRNEICSKTLKRNRVDERRLVQDEQEGRERWNCKRWFIVTSSDQNLYSISCMLLLLRNRATEYFLFDVYEVTGWTIFLIMKLSKIILVKRYAHWNRCVHFTGLLLTKFKHEFIKSM